MGGRRESSGNAGDRFEVGTGALYRSQAAQEFYPLISADAVELADENRPDFSCGSHVRTTASAAIQVLNGNDANEAFPLGRLAETQILGGIFEADRHWTVLEYNFIGPALGVPDLRRFKGATNVNGARFNTQMKAHRMRVEQIDEHGGQQMLSGVLLHMIEAALPMDNAADFDGFERRRNLVRDPAVFIDYLRYVNAAQLSGVEGLAARGGIEGSAIEINP